jgi:hypothetical protein
VLKTHFSEVRQKKKSWGWIAMGLGSLWPSGPAPKRWGRVWGRVGSVGQVVGGGMERGREGEKRRREGRRGQRENIAFG